MIIIVFSQLVTGKKALYMRQSNEANLLHLVWSYIPLGRDVTLYIFLRSDNNV